MQIISTDRAPTPAGHYSQAVASGGLVYVAGQLGADPADPSAEIGGVGRQTRQALANVASILAEAGSGLDHLLQVTIYVTDIGLWAEVNEAFAEALGDHRPARAIVPVNNFKDGFLVEIVAIAKQA